MEELPLCYQNDSWKGVRLPEFITCPYNLATNRQTRMLANLSLVDCYNKRSYSDAERNKILLQSAKDNLSNLSFFGLKEYPRETQTLFEHTFNIRFKNPISNLKPKTIHGTSDYFETLKESIQRQIEGTNALDIELYSYAKQLFFKRLEFAAQMKKARADNKARADEAKANRISVLT